MSNANKTNQQKRQEIQARIGQAQAYIDKGKEKLQALEEGPRGRGLVTQGESILSSMQRMLNDLNKRVQEQEKLEGGKGGAVQGEVKDDVGGGS